VSNINLKQNYNNIYVNRDVLLLAICQALFMTSTAAIISASALIGHMLAENKELATVPLACQFAGMTLSTIPISFMMKWIGRRNGFTCGLLTGIIGAILAVYAITTDNFLLFCFGSGLIGVMNAVGQYYRFAAADIAVDAFRSKAISLVLAGGVLASIGPLLASWSKEMLAPIDFAGIYIVVLILFGTSIIVIRFVNIPKPGQEEKRGITRPLTQIIIQPKFIIAMTAGASAYATMALLMTATPLAMGACNFGFIDSAQVIQWHVVGMYAPAFFTGSLIKKYGVGKIAALGSILLGLCIVINISGLSLAHFWIGGMILGIGWNFLFISGTTLLTETYTPSEKAKSQGFNDFIIFGSVACASLLSGFMHQNLGWENMNYAVIPIIILSIVVVIWLFFHKQLRRA
tara:strand:- start:1031 stop:2239 length:1209 start_codon:yes stop_codon:yes gene_type:complete